MKKAFTLLLFMLTGITRSNPVKLDIYLDFNECINCFISLNYINSINSSVTKNIFIDQKDSAVSREFLEQFTLGKHHIVYTAELKKLSVCRLFRNDSLMDEFPLKELPNKLRKINLMAAAIAPGTKIYKLPKALNVKSDRCEVIISGSRINVYDYILNKSIALQLGTDDSIRIMKEINGKSFSPQMFFQFKTDIDTTLYRKCKKTLHFLGKDLPHIEKSFINDSSLFLLINFSVPVLMQNDTTIVMRFFMYEYNFITHEKKMSFINDDAFSAGFKNTVFLNNALPFYNYRNTFYFPLLHYIKKKGDLPLLSAWNKRSKTQIYFSKMQNFSLSASDWNTFGMDSNLACVNERFYFFCLHGIVHDLKEGKSYIFRNSFFSSQVFVTDIRKTGEVFKLIVFINEKPFLVIYDHKLNVIKNKLALQLPEDYALGTLKFYDDNNALSINKTSTVIYLTLLPK